MQEKCIVGYSERYCRVLKEAARLARSTAHGEAGRVYTIVTVYRGHAPKEAIKVEGAGAVLLWAWPPKRRRPPLIPRVHAQQSGKGRCSLHSFDVTSWQRGNACERSLGESETRSLGGARGIGKNACP